MRGVHWCRWPGCSLTRCIGGYCKEHSKARWDALRRWGLRALGDPWRLDARPYWSLSGTGLL